MKWIIKEIKHNRYFCKRAEEDFYLNSKENACIFLTFKEAQETCLKYSSPGVYKIIHFLPEIEIAFKYVH